MTKFESSTDIGFKRVVAQLRRWLQELTAHDDADFSGTL